MAETECPIEVIDSQSVTMGLGLLAIATNTLVKSRKSLPEVVEEAKQIIP